MKERGVLVTIGDVELMVDGEYHPYRPPKRRYRPEDSEPSEEGQFCIDAVYHGNEDVTELLEDCEDVMQRVSAAAYEEVRGREADRAAGAADAWYDKMKDEGRI